jgi:hypothetical protein
VCAAPCSEAEKSGATIPAQKPKKNVGKTPGPFLEILYARDRFYD